MLVGMSRAIILAVVIVVVLTVYATVDCAMTDGRRAKVLQKPVWLVVILLLPVVGPLLWIFIGKMSRKQFEAPAAPMPDEDPAYLEQLRADREHDARIRALEEEMRKLDEEIEQARQETMRNHPSNHTGANPVIEADDADDDDGDADERNGADRDDDDARSS